MNSYQVTVEYVDGTVFVSQFLDNVLMPDWFTRGWPRVQVVAIYEAPHVEYAA